MKAPTPLPRRFEAKITRIPLAGCWIWMGSARSNRYGCAWYGDRTMAAHRAVYLASGYAIPEGMELLHRCDNGFCVNPHHLQPGTHQDNMTDMVRKGRSRAPTGDAHWTRRDIERAREIARRNISRSHACGERNGNAKINHQIAALIRSEKAANPSITSERLGAKFGIGRELTRQILKGLAWKS